MGRANLSERLRPVRIVSSEAAARRCHMMIETLLVLAAQHYPAALVTIEVREDRAYTRAHTITISPPTGELPRSAAERDRVIWIATRAWDGGFQSMDSQECPAVATVAASMDDSPPIPVSPPSRMVAPEPLPIPPTVKDGFATALKFRTQNPDGSRTDVTVQGGTDYILWGHGAVRALIGCWGPLEPL